MSTLEKRFWPKVNILGDDECWLWTGATDDKGYGRISDRPHSPKLAHRVAWELENGPIPAGVQIDHFKCFNHSCVNPAHLRPATHKQNQENRRGAASDSRSGVRGVFWDKRRSKWVARVGHEGRQIHVGHFDDIESAEAAVIAKRNELFTHNELDRMAVA